MVFQVLRPNTASLGFGLFLAIHASSVWGGAFPLLPLTLQTFDVMTLFAIVECLAFSLTFFASMAFSLYCPNLMRHRTAVLCGPIMCLGSICLIAPLYATEWLIGLVVIGAICLGVGSATFFLSWQRLFASQSAERGTLDLVLGMGYSAPLYFVLHAIPKAVAAYTIPFIFIPLAEVCLIDASKHIDFEQPMFFDDPRQHKHVYRHVVSFSWRSALCVGGIGFASGIARAVALEDPAMGIFVNYASMTGALLSAIALVWLWRHYTFRFDTVLAFRTVFPAVITAFLLVPYLDSFYLRIFAGIMYAVFTFATMIMMVQCAQASRDSGISPTYIYGFFAGIVYLLQGLGFLTGYGSAELFSNSPLQLATMALASVWVLAVTLYAVRGRFNAEELQTPAVEFISLSSTRSLGEPASADGRDAGRSKKDDAAPLLQQVPSLQFAHDARRSVHEGEALSAPPKGFSREVGDQPFRDKLSKQCAAVAKRFFLTTREMEVMELLARGSSVPRIADTLIISENTVKTYCKRLYLKLDVHKREELLDLIEEVG